MVKWHLGSPICKKLVGRKYWALTGPDRQNGRTRTILRQKKYKYKRTELFFSRCIVKKQEQWWQDQKSEKHFIQNLKKKRSLISLFMGWLFFFSILTFFFQLESTRVNLLMSFYLTHGSNWFDILIELFFLILSRLNYDSTYLAKTRTI